MAQALDRLGRRVPRDQPDRRCTPRAPTATRSCSPCASAAGSTRCSTQYRTKGASPCRSPRACRARRPPQRQAAAAEGSGAAAEDDGGAAAGYFPYKPYCSVCDRDLTTVTGYDDETTELSYTCACGHAETVLLPRSPARQAGVEGRLADALGLRGRRLRAVRRRPSARRVRRSWSAARSSVRVFGGEQPIGPMYAFVGISGMAKMSSSRGGVPTPADALTDHGGAAAALAVRAPPPATSRSTIAFDARKSSGCTTSGTRWPAARSPTAPRPPPTPAPTPEPPAPPRASCRGRPARCPYRHTGLDRRHHDRRRGADAAHPVATLTRSARSARWRRSGRASTGPSAGSPRQLPAEQRTRRARRAGPAALLASLDDQQRESLRCWPTDSTRTGRWTA